MIEVTTENEWQELLKKHNAVKVDYPMRNGNNSPDGAVWFESANAGFLFSARDADGKRSIIARF